MCFSGNHTPETRVGRAAPWASLFCILVLSSTARAGDFDDARRHFARGAGLAEKGDYARAVDEFKKSIELVPRPNAFFNLGKCYQELGQPVEAFETFQRLFKEFSPDDIDNPKEITAHLDEVRQRVGQLEVSAEPHGAAISVDKIEIGTIPMTAPVVLAPGRHALSLSLEGYETYSTSIEIGAGVKTVIPLIVLSKLEDPREKNEQTSTVKTGDAPPPAATPAPIQLPPRSPSDHPFEPRAATRGRDLVINGITVSVLGVAGLALGTAFNIKGANDRDDLKDASQGSRDTYDQLYHHTLPRDQAITIVGYVVGGVLVAAGAVFILVHRSRNRPRGRALEKRAALSVGTDGAVKIVF